MNGIKFMKSYDIYDNENCTSVGTLLCFDKEKTFIVELKDGLDEWNAPLLFNSFIKKGIYTIPREISLLWVKERIIPAERQNINLILANHRLKEYDELKFLEISKGKCSQDSLSVKKTETVPDYVKKRMSKNLTGMFASDGKSFICFFADDSVRKVDMMKMTDIDGVDKIIGNEDLFASGKVGTGGYFATFNDSIDIPAYELFKRGIILPVSKNDFISFVKNNVFDTAQTESELTCSRQNIAYLVKQGQLNPIKENVMGNLYLKEEVLKNKW
ncbi:MAG: hypothetical protein J5525_09725 [Lachnospiraceae bacterium]|nr:hypothetical protein [Lachnospiraceae bacterium]